MKFSTSTVLVGLGKLEKLRSVAIALLVIGRLTIPTSEGNVYREASGTEVLKREKYNKDTGEYESKELARARSIF